MYFYILKTYLYLSRCLDKAVSNPMQAESNNMQQQQQSQTIITSTPAGQQVTVIPAPSNVRVANIVQVLRSVIFGTTRKFPKRNLHCCSSCVQILNFEICRCYLNLSNGTRFWFSNITAQRPGNTCTEGRLNTDFGSNQSSTVIDLRPTSSDVNQQVARFCMYCVAYRIELPFIFYKLVFDLAS